ncbi:NACHT domain-containing protein [Aquimarina algiphila]|uniref:Uncharacterized protein n=1 Tax=Aquimarina algiphila TaxID=2047982 RepID=A0A554VJ63_9FLAO|nr:hypothetical protein [Aquimarina algiphila]TSE07929.1 hypothetical protein FOF46_14485 [Aquimarina algiphila]
MKEKIYKFFESNTPTVVIKEIENSDVDVVIIENLHFTTEDDLMGILSKKKLSKENISDSDKSKFIGNLKPHETHINRDYGIQPSSTTPLSWFHHDEESLRNLSSITKEKGNNKVLILGNAGLGKTHELKHLALEIWEDKSDPRIPIYSNFKNFTTQNVLEGFIYKKWKLIDNAIFIFDGIDEIQDIKDFISKLQNFIIALEREDAIFSMVISCRTNIYESLAKSISGFKIFYLKELVYLQGKRLLKIWSGSIIDDFSFNQNHLNFLRNPFQIKRLSEYINTHNKLPSNTAILWKSYIDDRLSYDASNKFKRIDLNTPLIKSYSKKISLINELRKSNVFNPDQLFKITKNSSSDCNEFMMNPLLDKVPASEDWYFVHRNIQEYFAALTISDMEFDDIIDIIQIENTGKTNPSLFNTISFLLNILDETDEKYVPLITWFLDNEPELLFKAEGDRISPDIREKVFKNYFQKECKEKTLWISTKRSFSVPEIAIFGSVPNNLTYLLGEIEDKKNHNRVIISAINLLAFFDIPRNEIPKLKTFLIDCLRDPEYNISIKSQIIDCITKQKLSENDDEYIDSIFAIFTKDSGNEINSILLYLIEDHPNPDRFFEFIYNEFLRAEGIQPRANDDGVDRRNDYKVKGLILKLEAPENFLAIAKHLFSYESKNILTAHSSLLQSFVEKCINLIEIDNSFINNILSYIKNDTLLYSRRSILKSIINRSGTNQRAISHLLNNFTFDRISFILTSILNYDSLNIVCEKMIELGLTGETVERFRNNIAYDSNRELAQRFEDIMGEKGIVFQSKLHSKEDKQNQETAFLNRIQSNFDILFQPDRIIAEIEAIFIDNDHIPMTSNLIHDMTMKWYNENGHAGELIKPLAVLQDLSNRHGINQFDLVREKLESDEFYRMDEIMTVIQRYEKDQRKYTVSKKQKLIISEWCERTSKSIDLEKIIIWGKSKGFGLTEDFDKLKVIFFYLDHFSFILDQSFLLDCVQFFNMGISNFDNENFESLYNKINDKDLFDARVIDNVQHKRLTSFALSRHVDYALENSLKQAYPKIRDYLTNLDAHHNESKKLKLYLERSSDSSVLKDCCTNIHSSICWSAIEILVERKEEKVLCIQLAHEYLDSGKDIFISNAIKVLFYWKESDAIRELIKVVDKGLLRVLSDNKFNDYDAVESYDIIEELYEVFYISPTEGLEGNFGKTFTQTYISNLSVSDEGYEGVQSVLQRINTRLKDSGDDLFYINLLIDKSKNRHVISKSESYNFKKALKIVEQLCD